MGEVADAAAVASTSKEASEADGEGTDPDLGGIAEA